METTDVDTQYEIIVIVIDGDSLYVVTMERPTNITHTLHIICTMSLTFIIINNILMNIHVQPMSLVLSTSSVSHH